MSLQPDGKELQELLRQDDLDRGYRLVDSELKQYKKTRDIEEAKTMSWVQDFTISEAEMDAISDPVWAFPNLVVQGHLIAIVAPPNGGKTTICEYVAAQLATSYDVFYVNADIAASDSKRSYQKSKSEGWTLLLPDMVAGKGMSNVVERLDWLNSIDTRYDGQVWIFDTLKKMTNIINKSEAKKLFQCLRGLSTKGMTIILLAHTNKRAESDGRQMYEGTGDLRADIDELIYLHPLKNSDDSMTVSTEPDKVRAVFDPITFEITRDRVVTVKDEFVDAKAEAKYKQLLNTDQEVISSFFHELKGGSKSQKELTDAASENGGHHRKAVIKVLNRYDGDLWLSCKGGENNKKIYSLPPVNGSFIPRRQVTTDITDTTGLTGTSQ